MSYLVRGEGGVMTRRVQWDKCFARGNGGAGVLLRKTRSRPSTILRRGSTEVGRAMLSKQLNQMKTGGGYCNDKSSRARQLPQRNPYEKQ